MARRITILWRVVVLTLFLAVIPIAIYTNDKHNFVDTESMLDVSVSIKTISHVRIDKVGDSVWESGSGSGFLVSSANCEVWTNHHVIEDAAVIEVFPRNWDRASGIPARVVNSTPRTDVAILQMDHCDGILEAHLGNSDLLRPGDETYAVGNPLGRNPDSISRGIISHTQRFATGLTPYLQTDAAINPGNSGGALFNRKGEVIGINTAIASTQDGVNVGIGYAVPINLVRKVVASLHDGPPSWGDAGISEMVSSLSPDEAEIFKVPDGNAAIILTRTPEEGPAADKLREHDVIYKINDVGVTGVAQAMRTIASYDKGDEVKLDIIRDGEQQSVDLTLEDGWQADDEQQPEFYTGLLGMTLEMWTEQDEERGAYETPVITKVQSLGPAHKAHISSSQRGVGFRGPFLVSFQLDVKTVSGVVFEGSYRPIHNRKELMSIADEAFREQTPLLLEIQLWARENPMDLESSLLHVNTAFYKVTPALSTAAAPMDDPTMDFAADTTSPAAKPVSQSEKKQHPQPEPRAIRAL